MALRPLAVVVALSVGVVVPAALADPPSPQAAAGLLVRAQQRPVDQATNPEHAQRHALAAPGLAQLQHPDSREDPRREAEVDPFLAGWAPERGAERDVSIINRYGARLHGHLSMPRAAAGRLPAVVLLTGGAGTEHGYREMAHGLAEAGYVVLGLNVQGDFGSQLKPADPQPSTPQNEHCEPGAWQEPQEAGVRETGPCAGEYPDAAPDAGAAAFVTRDSFDSVVAGYEQVKPRKLFGALDGVRWLLSADNPWRDRIDGERIGIAGHSLGAHGALLAANVDPQRRFRAAVTFDGFGRLAPTGAPSVPTLFQLQDLSDLPHHRQPPELPGDQDGAAFKAAGVPTGVVHLAGSTHNEWSYVPPELLAAVGGASRDGKRVALHYAVAWFDLWLKPGPHADARRRLTAATYSGSTDGSSRGEGPWDALTQRTVSPRIGGESTREHLSPLFRSWIDVPGARCADLRAGC